MTGSKNRTIKYSYQQITTLIAAAAQFGNQGQCDNIDNTDGNHGTDGTEGINFCTFFNVLCHSTTESSIWNIDTGITQYQDTIGYGHIHYFGSAAPVRMSPEGNHQHNCSQRCCNEQPGTITSPASIGSVGQTAYNGIIDSVPEA